MSKMDNYSLLEDLKASGHKPSVKRVIVRKYAVQIRECLDSGYSLRAIYGLLKKIEEFDITYSYFHKLCRDMNNNDSSVVSDDFSVKDKSDSESLDINDVNSSESVHDNTHKKDGDFLGTKRLVKRVKKDGFNFDPSDANVEDLIYGNKK